MVSQSGIKAGAAYVELFLKDKLSRGLQRASARLKTWGASMQSMGTRMVAVSAAMAVPIAMVTRSFADFDDQMRTVKAVTGATGRDFDMLTAKAKLLGRTTSYTASEVAGGMVEAGRAGFDPGQIDASIAAMLDLALHSGRGPVTLADISVNQGISLSYLEQLFAALRGKQLVRGVRGPGGGYYLGRPSGEISIADIICAVDEWVSSPLWRSGELPRWTALSHPPSLGPAERRDLPLPERDQPRGPGRARPGRKAEGSCRCDRHGSATTSRLNRSPRPPVECGTAGLPGGVVRGARLRGPLSRCARGGRVASVPNSRRLAALDARRGSEPVERDAMLPVGMLSCLAPSRDLSIAGRVRNLETDRRSRSRWRSSRMG